MVSEIRRKAPKSAYKPGTSGNPGGRPKSELNKVLSQYLGKTSPKGKTYTELLVARLLELAISQGNIDAIEFIWDRLEGKPVQSVDLGAGAAIGIGVFILKGLRDRGLNSLVSAGASCE